MQGLLNLFDIYGERFLVVGLSLLSLTFVTLMFLWGYNRRRFMNYKHHIPARVMQGYLDSIIQNSSALKSSLLRGGGSETVPLIQGAFPGDGLARAGDGGASTADLAQKNAEIASLKSQMTEKESMITDLEEKMGDLLGKLREAEDNAGKFKTEADAFSNHAKAGGDEATLLQLSEITKERDLLKEKLKEYEFIESDLAEIPKLQRTVETFKATLKQMGVDPDEVLTNKSVPGTAKVTKEATAAPAPAAAPVATQNTATPDVAAALASIESAEKIPEAKTQPAPETTAAPAATASAPVEGKKADDDLLSQFEKMLG